MVRMAIADPAHRADDCLELANRRRQPSGLASLAARLLTIAIAACAMALAGCARNPVQRDLNPVNHEARAAPVRAPARPRIYAETRRQAEPPLRRPDPALLEPQPAPNCEFKRADIKAVDPDEWARLETEYERQCYQDAEQAARERLNQLQAAVR
jgi:hypothetical protein